jgi:hypothetical protein
MKVGDLVSVCYRYSVGCTDSNKDYSPPLLGFIFETPDDNGVWKMWCLETYSVHILAPHLDVIEVVSENR